MFEITGDDIAALGDEDLRALIVLLCEADLRRRGLSTAAVTAGGDQDAPDGGVDVRVALPPETAIGGFIPRSATVFQSKKPDMARKAILGEMRPHDALRPAIAALADADGAYIIVSSGANTTDTVLEGRKAAMKEALHGLPNAANVALDFYDRTRVATWVRDHPALTLWVRLRIGRALHGWQPFGRWSRQPDTPVQTYLLDETARIRTGALSEGDGLGAADGIDRIRATLREPGKAVRLVGLSGVGKTRLAEALFDPEVGGSSLDPSLAFYTDVADEPDPPPASLASDLIARRTRAILIVDNCPPETHWRLTEIVRAGGSTVSLLTVEYDIQDDEPEGTDVFILETSSREVIEQLVSRRFPALSAVDARTIAELSDGNARVALALAGVAPRSGTVASLGDRELFRRLFEQRTTPAASLLPIAQACALLYSFDGEAFDGDAAELPILGALVDRTAREVYAATAELRRRQLMQARGRWRAMLPHAIANRLAAAALEEIPRQQLLAAFVSGASDRILRSFSRRLGYLDSSKEARDIVRSWLAPSGLLADIPGLNDFGVAVLTNVAPVAPEAALSALERAIRSADQATLRNCARHVRLLRALAYEPDHFERVAALLIRLAQLPKERHWHEDASDALASLFPVALSGTMAPLALRLPVVERLLRSEDEAEQRLGIDLLRAVLKTDFFSSSYEFEFGARSRGYGLHPNDEQELRAWFEAGLRLAEPFLIAGGAIGKGVRTVLVQSFRGLWVQGGQAVALTRLAHTVVDARGFWRDGWAAARQTRIFDGKHLTPDALAELGALEDFLRPRNTIEMVRAVILNEHGGYDDIEDLDDIEGEITRAMDREAATVARLAEEVAADETAWQALLPDLVASHSHKAGRFGEHLARFAAAPRAVWTALVAQTAATPEPGIAILCGFVNGVEQRDGTLAQELLDAALEDPVLGPWLPTLQISAMLDGAALARLHRALDAGVAPIERYVGLAYGSCADAIAESELKRLLMRIAEVADGDAVARRILFMRYFANRNAGQEIGPDLIEAGRVLLAGLRFERGHRDRSREDHDLALLVRVALTGEDGRAIVHDLCRALMLAMSRYEIHRYEYDDLVRALFDVQPTEMLDTLFSGDEVSDRRSAHWLNDLPRAGKSPMGAVPDDVVLEWCDRAPAKRYILAATFVRLFTRADESAPLEWTDLTLRLLAGAPDPGAVFSEIVDRLRPRTWSGSLASAFASRLELLDRLDIGALPALAGPLDRARAALSDQVGHERRREQEEAEERDNRFE